MAIVANAAPSGKPFSRNAELDRRSRKKSGHNSKKYQAPVPGAARVNRKIDSSAASRSIYDGRDRLGSYRRVFDRWIAVDRMGEPIGQFDSEVEASNAIWAAGAGR
jgi:hypothetical protein